MMFITFTTRSLPALALAVALAFGLAGCDSSGYEKRGATWQHEGVAFTPADAASFKPIDSLFARDAKRGYYRGAEIEGSDGASFEVVSEHEARDRGAVYHADTYRLGQEYWTVQHLRVGRIAGADPATYTSLGQGYARDKARVYQLGVPFKVRDVASFVPLDGSFGRDAQRGYHARTEIPGSDGASFATIDALDPGYARDKARVYFGYRDVDLPRGPNEPARAVVVILRQADPATLRMLGHGYAADARRVWHRGAILEGADAASFAVETALRDEVDAHDVHGAWSQGRRVAAVQATSR